MPTTNNIAEITSNEIGIIEGRTFNQTIQYDLNFDDNNQVFQKLKKPPSHKK